MPWAQLDEQLECAGDEIVGRTEERARIASFVSSDHDGVRALVLEGEAGLGKSTLLAEARELVASGGRRVLECRPTEAETELPYAALGDLLGGTLDQPTPLVTPPQRRALEGALLLSHPSEDSDRLAVALATLNTLRSLARESPLAVVVDDVQWLDPPTAHVLAFALRRLTDERVLLLVARRAELPSPLELDAVLPAGRVLRVPLAQLDLEALDDLFLRRLGVRFLRPMLLRLHRTSGGNPFLALELARAIDRDSAPPLDGLLPVPDTVQLLVRGRLEELSESARDALLVVSALAHPTRQLVSQLAAETAIAEAVRERVLVRDGERLRFSHPLLGSFAYGDAEPERRRLVHARLADVVPEPEERARHLALAATCPDATVADALERAAESARRRGAPDAAAGLAERAATMTPADQPAVRRRLLLAASCSFDAGDPPSSVALLERALSAAAVGGERAEILLQLGTVRGASDGLDAARATYGSALVESGLPDELLARIHQHLAFATQLTDVRAAAADADVALELAERVGRPRLLARALATRAMIEFQLGRGVQRELLERAHRLEEETGESQFLDESPRFVLGYQLQRIGALDEAREVFIDLCARATARGDASLCLMLVSLSYVELRAGRIADARRAAEDAWRTAAESGRVLYEATALCARARVEAWEGEVDGARTLAARALELAAATGQSRTAADAASAIGSLELSLGAPGPAYARLEPALSARRAQGVAEPCLFSFLPDAVEALVALGRLEDAEQLLAPFEERGRELDRPWAQLTAARARALLAAAQGELPAADAALGLARKLEALVPEPLEWARTRLVAGIVARRFRRYRQARESFDEAARAFGDLGAAPWVERAHTEATKIAGRRTAATELTATEREIAELVARGRSNHEVANALFLSPKTVEWNLSKVYRKLHVSSRTELAAKFARKTGPASSKAGEFPGRSAPR
jgi:DNA-binding CsgD family transcriptional regulator